MSSIYRCDMNGKLFSYPSVELDYAEIAKVCQEISSQYGKYKDRELIMHRTKDVDRNWCIYYVENRGYGDYNIIEKFYD